MNSDSEAEVHSVGDENDLKYDNLSDEDVQGENMIEEEEEDEDESRQRPKKIPKKVTSKYGKFQSIFFA